MKLTIVERLNFAALYPKESNLITQIIMRDIDRKVNLSQKEIKDIDLKINDVNKNYEWNPNKAKTIEVKFTDEEIRLLVDRVNELDKGNKITLNLVDLCLKIKDEKEIKDKKEIKT